MAGALGLALLVLLGALAPPSRSGDATGNAGRFPADLAPDGASSGPASLTNHTVHFGTSALGLSVSYDPVIAVSNGTVIVGTSSAATIRLNGTMATVALTLPGLAPAHVALGALGPQSVVVPGLTYAGAGLPLSVYVDLMGWVNGSSFVGPHGTGVASPFSWSTPESLVVAFEATGPVGSRVAVGVSNLSYSLTIGVVARGTGAGLPVSVDLLAPTALPASPGTPSNVSGNYTIVAALPASPPAGSPTPAAPGSYEGTVLLGALIAGLLLAATAIAGTLRRGSGPRWAGPCEGCGQRVPQGAAFCPACGRPTVPPRPAPVGDGPGGGIPPPPGPPDPSR